MYMLDVYLFQQTALTSLKGRQLRIFSDAVSDDRFNASHEYSTAEGFPQTILNIAVDRWSGQGFIIARIRNCDLWLYSARQRNVVKVCVIKTATHATFDHVFAL